jgi:hypothetical protein
LDRDAAATTAAPASPASAAPPAISGIFTWPATSPTDPTAFCAPSATVSLADAAVSLADLPAFRAVEEVFLAFADAFDRERLAVPLAPLELAPFREAVRGRVDAPLEDPLPVEPFRDVLFVRVPDDFEDELLFFVVFVCAMPHSPAKSVQSQCDTRRGRI